jgi:hypothetical protein|tara:strand:- start:686 stop:1150 length:465 start_codon:yes stop_codon:yes gene_type:complete
MATLQDFQGQLLVFLIIMFTANALFLVVGGFTGVNLINGPESFSFLPQEVTDLNISGVTGKTDLTVEASPSITALITGSLQIPFWKETVDLIDRVGSAISNVFFTGYIGVLNLIEMPAEIQFVIVTVISILQILGLLALLVTAIQSLPIIGSGG